MNSADGDLRAFVIGHDHLVLRREFFLDDHLDVVGGAATLERAAEVLAANSVSVVVVDMTNPDSDAPETIRQIAATSRPVGVVALTASPLDDVLVSRALGAGAQACVTTRTIAEHGIDPFLAAAELRPFLPTGEVVEMLAAEDGDENLTSSERDALLRNLVIGLIPLAGVLVGLISLLWRRYLGHIGVRPVDLAVDPATRIADLFFTISVVVGLIGPQVFVGSWLELIVDSTNERSGAWIRRHRVLSRIALAVCTFVVAVALAQVSELLFALFVGPFVGGLLLAKVFDLDDDLPKALRITKLRPGRAAAGVAIIFAVFLALLSYEVVVRGPSFDESGQAGWIAPSVLGFKVVPVQVTAVDDGGVSEMLYLGGNADLYVLVDPCDGDRVDLVSVGATRISVIERVHCN